MLNAGREKLVHAYVQGIVEPRCRKAERAEDDKDDALNEDEKFFLFRENESLG